MRWNLKLVQAFLLPLNAATFVLFTQFVAVLVVYRHRTPMSSPFFRMSIFYSLVDMLVIVQSYALLRVPTYGLWLDFYRWVYAADGFMATYTM